MYCPRNRSVASIQTRRSTPKFTGPVDPTQRDQQVVQMATLISQALPMIMRYRNFDVSAYSSALTGPNPQALDSLVHWNIYDWELHRVSERPPAAQHSPSRCLLDGAT